MIHEHELENMMDDNIDLTPVIDVLFLLLIFFLMTTTFSKPVLNIVLPQAESAKVAAERQVMTVVIDAEGTVTHDGRIFSPEELPELMEISPGLPINFQVDKEAPFDAFMSVVDQARVKGRTDFVITTEHGKTL